ncbi:MAG: 3-oxoacyl-(acyl-carrier-protein) synthase [Pseudobdellovibrio sp.]|nr:3-oxoacyl-(acyl-carrier-protein) synthase [Pseudobdellovibrio sp.]
MYRSKVSGVGSYLPEKILSNHDLEKIVETSHEWIVQRTGIVNRHVLADEEGNSDMCVRAAQRALEDANLKIEDIDMICVATISGDYKMPATACLVQKKLGAKNVMSFDLNAACSGFIYSLHIADQFVRTGVYKNVMIIGSENLTRMLNYKDRETCILFGDGAGCFIISRSPEGDKGEIMTSLAHAEGSLYELLWASGGGTKEPISQKVIDTGSQYMIMNGREIFKNATRTMAACCKEAMENTGVTPDQLDWVVPHQANMRITEAVSNFLKFPMERIVSTVHETGNTSSASIPLAFDAAYKDGRIKRGQLIMVTAFGAGLTSGAAILRF